MFRAETKSIKYIPLVKKESFEVYTVEGQSDSAEVKTGLGLISLTYRIMITRNCMNKLRNMMI